MELFCLLISYGSLIYIAILCTKYMISKPIAQITENIPLLSSINYTGVSYTSKLHKLNTKDLEHKLDPTLTHISEHPLIREIADIRPPKCKDISYSIEDLPVASVVITAYNEIPIYLFRSIYSILYRTSPKLLKEIIIVDDCSEDEEYQPGGLVDQLIEKIPKVRKIRMPVRSGIVPARLKGIYSVLSDVFVILDSHIEVTEGWLEPLLHPISKDPKTIAMPFIDSIKMDTMEPVKGGIGCRLGFIWMLMEHGLEKEFWRKDMRQKSESDYIESPTMAGGLFAAHKMFFIDLGGYDEGMKYWGAENIELSFRLWQCGGNLQCTSCSHVHHRFGNPKPYSTPSHSTEINRLRTAAVWLDEYAHLVWKRLGSPVIDYGDISQAKELRKALKCRSFNWYLKNVYPESAVIQLPHDVPYMGKIKSNGENCLTTDLKLGDCNDSQFMYFKKRMHIHLKKNDEICLEYNGNDLKLENCVETPYYTKQKWSLKKTRDDTLRIQNVYYRKCITTKQNSTIVMDSCSNAINWEWEVYVIPQNFTIPKL